MLTCAFPFIAGKVTTLSALQYEGKFGEVMYLQEEMKSMPFGDVWEEFLERCGTKSAYLDDIKQYETEVLSKR